MSSAFDVTPSVPGERLERKLGAATAKAPRSAFGMHTVAELLAHYPRRYATRGELTDLAFLPPGEHVTIVAQVRDCSVRPMRGRPGVIVTATITDGHGALTLTWFGKSQKQQEWRLNQLVPGARGVFSGKVTQYRDKLQLAHPDYELFEKLDEDQAKAWSEVPIPIYPATAALPSWKVAKALAVVLDQLGDLPDPVPEEVRERRGLLPYSQAIQLVHRPQTDEDWRAARSSLRFREAFILQAALLKQRADIASWHAVPRTPVDGGYLTRFDAALPFALTDDQKSVGEQIAADLAGESPMNRLIQGEVGSGKTVVALRAMLAVADAGGQSALLAPTEVLAGQHFRSICAALGPDLSAAVIPTLITGALTAGERRRALLRAVSGQARIVVGTHALISDAVEFYDLGLVVVDEQHRFGVDQREALRMKAVTAPHVAILTATPIPRTVAMTVFGDLDVSTIHQLPKGRAGIDSFVVPLVEKPGWIGRVWARLGEEISAGRQAFVVCPAITAKDLEEGSDLPDGGESAEAAGTNAPSRPAPVTVEETIRQAKLALPSARIAGLHGRLPAEEKDAVMRAFAAGELDLLVATTVIEVGIDVPNASAMVVLDADRFGVSQLHQLRGRIGRGEARGVCLFVTTAEPGSLARQRVETVAATLDGFELAQADLELRREGDVLGSSQSGGRSSLKLLRVTSDADVIADARAVAAGLLAEDPLLTQHESLRSAIAQRLDESEQDFLAKS